MNENSNNFNPTNEPISDNTYNTNEPEIETTAEYVSPDTEQSAPVENIYERYNDSVKSEPTENEPFYSPYSSAQQNASSNYSSAYSQPYTEYTPEHEKKKKAKGFKAFIVALVAVVVCVAILIGTNIVNPNSVQESTDTKGDSTEIELNDSPVADTNNGDEMTPIQIAEKAKKFNVGILLYGKTQSFMSSSTSSLAGEGSGIVMGKDDSGKYTYILTCAHVISDVKSSNYSMTVQDSDGNTYDGILVGFDEKTDIGVIKIEADGLTAAEFGDSSKLAIGQTVYAIGNPGGVEFFGSFTSGMVSSIDRPISSESGYEMECIQHTTPINSGNSGGALMNEFGQVIGINSSKIVSTGYEGMAFTIPISDAKPIIDDIIANGYVTDRPKLGITYALATNYQQYLMIVKLKDLPTESLVIASIASDSSLAKTDVKVGDLIIAVNGENLDKADVLLDKIEKGKVGDKLKLTICRVNDDYSVSQFNVDATLVEDTGSTDEDTTQQTPSSNYWEKYFGNGF